jgi:hypothetical protein
MVGRSWIQATGVLPAKPFGATKSHKPQNSRHRFYRDGLNAKLPQHLGLPRPVGNYTVVRTTAIHTSSAKFALFAPFQDRVGTEPKWLNMCGITDVNAANAVNLGGNTNVLEIPFPGGTPTAGMNALSVVPSAMTVQVINGTAVSASNGVFLMGRSNQQWAIGSSTDTYNDQISRFISYFSPRMLSGGRLALRSVISHGYPLDMGEYSEFAPIKLRPASPATWSDLNMVPSALSPIIFVQEGEPADVTFLITMEWRVRFDPSNPAVSSHTYHPPLPDEEWGAIIKRAQSMGAGVEDVVEVAERVADFLHPIP